MRRPAPGGSRGRHRRGVDRGVGRAADRDLQPLQPPPCGAAVKGGNASEAEFRTRAGTIHPAHADARTRTATAEAPRRGEWLSYFTTKDTEDTEKRRETLLLFHPGGRGRPAGLPAGRRAGGRPDGTETRPFSWLSRTSCVSFVVRLLEVLRASAPPRCSSRQTPASRPAYRSCRLMTSRPRERSAITASQAALAADMVVQYGTL